MKMTELFIAELEREAAATRRTLERVPEIVTTGSRTRNQCRSVIWRNSSRGCRRGLSL